MSEHETVVVLCVFLFIVSHFLFYFGRHFSLVLLFGDTFPPVSFL